MKPCSNVLVMIAASNKKRILLGSYALFTNHDFYLKNNLMVSNTVPKFFDQQSTF